MTLMTFHHFEPGIAPSRENAHVQRDAAVVQPIPQKIAKTMSGMRSANAPPGLPTALRMMTGTGCPDCNATSDGTDGRTKINGIMKSRPQKRLRRIVRTIAFGTCVAGECVSSHMLEALSVLGTLVALRSMTYDMIIPVEDVAYAACSKPTQKLHPSGQPEDGSKLVKTYSASCRPFFATTRTVTMIAITPTKVQPIANVWVMSARSEFRGHTTYIKEWQPLVAKR